MRRLPGPSRPHRRPPREQGRCRLRRLGTRTRHPDPRPRARPGLHPRLLGESTVGQRPPLHLDAPPLGGWRELTIEEKPDITEATIADEPLAAVLEHPGASWSKLRPLVRGNDGEKCQGDQFLAAGSSTQRPVRATSTSPFPDDPTLSRAEPSTALARPLFPTPDGAPDPSRATVPYVSRHRARNGTGEPGRATKSTTSRRPRHERRHPHVFSPSCLRVGGGSCGVTRCRDARYRRLHPEAYAAREARKVERRRERRAEGGS